MTKARVPLIIAAVLAVLALGPVAGAAPPSIDLTFDAPVQGTVQDVNSEGTGFTGFQSSTNQPAAYLKDNLLLADGKLVVDPTLGDVFSTGAGNNDQQNALRVSFDGSAPFAVTAVLTPPLAPEKNVYGGIYVGFDEDNYVKVVLGNNGGLVIQRLREAGGVAQQQPANAPEAGLLTASRLTLSLEVTPSSGAVQARYALDDGPMIDVGQPVALAGVGGPQSFAGILTTDQSGHDDARIVYDRFTVSPLNPAPSPAALEPATAEAGSPGFPVIVDGSGFVPGSSVRWNGAALPTTYLDATHLRADVPAADLAAPGTALITVTTPAPGGGDSVALPFLVTAPVPRPVAPSSAGTPPVPVPVAAAAVAPGNLVAPAVRGTPRVGAKLRCDAGSWSGAPTAYSYVWLRDAKALSAAGTSYSPVARDAAHRLRCRVTARNDHGTATALSAAIRVGSAAVTAPMPVRERISYLAGFSPTLMKLERLGVAAPNGARVTLKCVSLCRAHGTRVVRGGHAQLAGIFGSSLIRVGAVIEVRITKPGALGVDHRLHVTAQSLTGLDADRARCLAPSTGRPVACPRGA